MTSDQTTRTSKAQQPKTQKRKTTSENFATHPTQQRIELHVPNAANGGLRPRQKPTQKERLPDRGQGNGSRRVAAELLNLVFILFFLGPLLHVLANGIRVARPNVERQTLDSPEMR